MEKRLNQRRTGRDRIVPLEFHARLGAKVCSLLAMDDPLPYGRIASAVMSVASALLSAGCVMPVPIIHSTSLPNIESKLPDDLRGMSAEVLVVKQMASTRVGDLDDKKGKSSPSSVTIEFMKGRELLAYSRTLSLSSTAGIGLLVAVGVAGGTATLSGVEYRLERLCVVTPDGRLIALVGAERNFAGTLDKPREMATSRASGPCSGPWGCA